MYTVAPKWGLALGVGARIDGVPVVDALGESNGFRRPGYAVSVEPLMQWMRGRYTLSVNDNGYDVAAMVAHARAQFGVRLYTGLPFGHTPEKLTLPVGGRCAFHVRDGRARLVLSDYNR